MKHLLFCFLFSTVVLADSIKTDTSSPKKEIKTENSEYRIKLFEPNHRSYMFYFGGTIDNDYDQFGKIIKQNGFTNIGIEF